MEVIANSLTSLKEIPTSLLFKELKKRKNIDCLVIDDDYILKVNKKDVNV